MLKTAEEIKLEILKASHLEHESALRTLAMIYHVDNPKRKRIMDEANNIVHEMQKLVKPD